MSRKSRNLFSVVLTVVIVLLLLMLLVSLLGRSGEMPILGKTLQLQYDGKEIKSEENFAVILNQQYNFTVQNAKDFTVQIVPRITKNSNFSFTVDGVQYSYDKVKDLSKGFKLELKDDGFTLTPLQDLPQMLQAQFDGAVENVPTVCNLAVPYIDLIVSDKSGKSVVVPLTLFTGTSPTDIHLSETNIVF